VTASASDGDPETDTASHDTAWLLVLENLVFAAEAEVRWLDHVETRLAREAGRPRRRAHGIPTQQQQQQQQQQDHTSTTA
jgi:hypothetical protein